MTKRMSTLAMIVVLGGLVVFGCQPEMVGAPCIPETDKGLYNDQLSGTTYSIETRSVQCETRICLTSTAVDSNEQQLKYSFCSCRCKDLEGNTLQSNPDKYAGILCECPPDTLCEPVLGDIKEAPEKITGSYCIPSCIATPCEPGEICTPSSNSEEPWKWTCEEEDDDDE